MALYQDFRGFENLYDARVLTEDGSEFPVHRVLLALKSEYFRDLLSNVPLEEKDILIPNIQGSTMELVINYIYTGELDSEGHNIRDILLAAYFLCIENLLTNSRSLAIRRLTTTNCVPLFVAGYKIEKLGVLKACHRFLVVHFQDIVRNPYAGFGDLPYVSFEQFISMDTLNISSENQVWEAIVLWIGTAPEKKEMYLKNLLACVRFDKAEDDLISEVLGHSLVEESSCYEELKEAISIRSPTSKHRIPEMFFVFTKVYINLSDYSEGIKVYLTYDDDIDIWRKVSSKILCAEVILHGQGPLILMFEASTNVIHAFDIISKTWSTLISPAVPREEYNVVKLGSHIYILGGISPEDETEEAITSVERYDFESQRWGFVSSHFALSQGAAVAINGNICAIGTISGFFSEFLAAQVYFPDTDTWQAISAPRIYRRKFAFVVYRHQLFVLGGHSSVGYLNSVEVYYAEENEWRQFTDLPFPYFMPKAVIIKDVLYVYDNADEFHDSFRPPVFWNEASGEWEVVEASSPFCDLKMYQFCTIEDPEVILEMRRENTDARTEWVESPFFAHLNS